MVDALQDELNNMKNRKEYEVVRIIPEDANVVTSK